MDKEQLAARIRASLLDPRDPDDLEVTSGALILVANGGYAGLVEDMLTISKRRGKDPVNLYRLQMWMLDILLSHEQAIHSAKAKLNTLQQDSYEQSMRLRKEIQASRLVKKAIRTIGDGIVWRLLGHDRAAFLLLAQGPDQPAIATPGLRAELEELQKHVVTQGCIPLLCSLTNCVRLGDIIIFSESSTSGTTTTLVEVKAGDDRTPRFRRQRVRNQEVVRLITEREGQLQEVNLTIYAHDIHQINHLPSVHNLVKEALNAGAAMRRFENHLVVECIDWRSPNAAKQAERVLLQRKGITDMWEASGDCVMEAANSDLKRPVSTFAPYAVFPFDDDIRALIMTNQVLLRSWLNLDAIFRRLEAAGWEILEDTRSQVNALGEHSTSIDPTDLSLVRIRKKGLTLDFPSGRAARFFYEFLSPKSLVQEVELLSQLTPSDDRRRSLSYYPREARIWD